MLSEDDRSVPWSYENGKRMSGCLCCVSAVEQGTGKMWEPGIQLYLSKEEPKYNAVVDACAMAYSKLDPSVLPKYYPGESVLSSQERGHNMGRFGLQVSEVKISHLVKFSHMGYMGLVRILSSKVKRDLPKHRTMGVSDIKPIKPLSVGLDKPMEGTSRLHSGACTDTEWHDMLWLMWVGRLNLSLKFAPGIMQICACQAFFLLSFHYYGRVPFAYLQMHCPRSVVVAWS